MSCFTSLFRNLRYLIFAFLFPTFGHLSNNTLSLSRLKSSSESSNSMFLSFSMRRLSKFLLHKDKFHIILHIRVSSLNYSLSLIKSGISSCIEYIQHISKKRNLLRKLGNGSTAHESCSYM